KISVGKTLRLKAPLCFKERNSKVCGNSRVEDGEDCDPGLLHRDDDPCCSEVCKFKRGARCRQFRTYGLAPAMVSVCVKGGFELDKNVRLWDFIDKLDINTFGKFLADNIVGSVVVFSLVFWIPLSILVHCVNEVNKEWIPPQSKAETSDGLFSSQAVFTPQSQDMLNNLESASVRIVKPPQPPSFSAIRTGPSSQFLQQQSQVQALAPAAACSDSTQDPGSSYAANQDSVGEQRMATILEDISSDSHLGEEGPLGDFTTAGASSSATKSSYEDLTEQNPSIRDRRRLTRQDRLDTKETEC
ncbi:hypothetical protein XENOCAPTIV_006184, partial [Xenoophorus captivus]